VPSKRPILQIPLPGGSGVANSGAVQFQNDWPGLFIRGDHAIILAGSIRHVIQCLTQDKSDDTIEAIKHLEWIATVVEQQVKI
jgi:hypothetical protein